MPPKRFSSHTLPPAQRRPRTERACHFCRMAKQRCEPTEYGTNDRPCRRCVSQKLDCNLPRAARSQSPSSGPGTQGPGSIQQHPIAPHSAGGAFEKLTLSPETNVPYSLHHESVQVPMRGWPPLAMGPEEGQGSSTTAILPPEHVSLHPPNFLPATPGMECCYQQGFPNAVRGPDNPGPSYFAQGYYVETTYAPQSIGSSTPDSGYSLEDLQADDAGASGNNQDGKPSGSSET